MSRPLMSGTLRVTLCATAMALLAVQIAVTQQTPVAFGGAYSGLEPRRQELVKNWVARFIATTGQKLEAGPFYDEVLNFSSKTTFDAVTHALMTTSLTDRSGGSLGDALALVERVESVRGEVAGASGDRQFRMYVRLTERARDVLERSREFKRGVDNSVFHKGYPINYRGQGGVPSIQISIALDDRRADIDVDYRSASFPAALFNGHLNSSNSDVRAGNNFNRHTNRWSGFQNWWQGFFGVRLKSAPDATPPKSPFALPKTPRAGKKSIDVMVHDFLNAWLVEGDVVAAMGYVSEQAYACLAQDADDPSSIDRGMVPFQLMANMKAAQDALGKHDSLAGLTVGVRFTRPELKVVDQPHHAQFVVYSVPDDVAAGFDCESRLTLEDAKPVRRTYGNYSGAAFNISGRKDHTVALLWARENGYWKIVSWQVGADEKDTAPPDAPPDPTVVRITADTSLVQAARDFLESWLIRQEYGAAFRYVSTKSYACYDLVRSPDEPAAASLDDAGQKIRAGLERSVDRIGKPRTLDAVLSSAAPFHPAIRVMDHPDSRTFTLSSIPNALADAAECAARASGSSIPEPLPLEYGNGFEMTVRFKTRSGDAPILRLLWRKENDAWRITSYGLELP